MIFMLGTGKTRFLAALKHFQDEKSLKLIVYNKITEKALRKLFTHNFLNIQILHENKTSAIKHFTPSTVRIRSPFIVYSKTNNFVCSAHEL